jgi:hypothetical protein
VRTLVLLLVLANLSFLGFTRLDASREGEASHLTAQVQPDKIKLLTPQQVAALGPAKVAALADVCLEWGPLSEADRPRALSELEPFQLGKLLSQRRAETNNAFWVYLPSVAARADAERRAVEAKAKGIADAAVVETATQRYAVSLGGFPTEEAARTRLGDVLAKGAANARVGPRQQTIVLTTLVVRDPQAPLIAKVRDLAPQYSGSDAKVGNCERT